ncbi:S-adenosyl-L-methionine-dependent methyltransferase [Chytridium lagenaria]|nr:S-adenosyl-L-methionine-dependent methyltransferase [Chytridium lagenaria]
MSHPTPTTTHLTKDPRFRDVYDPAEDSFLFLDALENDLDALKSTSPAICLEIGSGSGVVITFLSTLLGPTNALYLATDINRLASLATLQTSHLNSTHINPIITHFASPLRLHHSIDVILFNPPYVVTPSSEVGSTGIEAAWAGGIDGREVIDAVFPVIDDLLSESGVFYMVVIQENRPEEIMEEVRRMYKLEGKNIMTRRAGREHLSILKFNRA